VPVVVARYQSRRRSPERVRSPGTFSLAAAGSNAFGSLAWPRRKSLKAAHAADNGVKILGLLFGTAHDRTPWRGARGAPHAVHFTLRFSAEVFPLFATSSYWTC
jgi:hypothetical protein